jgi:hypothetical protein
VDSSPPPGGASGTAPFLLLFLLLLLLLLLLVLFLIQKSQKFSGALSLSLSLSDQHTSRVTHCLGKMRGLTFKLGEDAVPPSCLESRVNRQNLCPAEKLGQCWGEPPLFRGKRRGKPQPQCNRGRGIHPEVKNHFEVKFEI